MKSVLYFLLAIVFSVVVACSPETVSELMWGKKSDSIKGVTKSCSENVGEIKVIYEEEPTVCNHEYHYQEWFPCLPKVCFDTIDARETRIENLKNKLYKQYLIAHKK
jgi:hypothetical protein